MCYRRIQSRVLLGAIAAIALVPRSLCAQPPLPEAKASFPLPPWSGAASPLQLQHPVQQVVFEQSDDAAGPQLLPGTEETALQMVAPPLTVPSVESRKSNLQIMASQPAAMNQPPETGAMSPGQTAPAHAADQNAARIARGRNSFQSYCVGCHDAARSTEKRKTYAAWLTVVRRMAAKPDADIPAGEFEPIAAYLASLGGGSAAASGDAAAEQPWSINATISTMWRDANTTELENPDFFVDAWFGVDWQPQGPISASIMACTSCHADFNRSQGFTLELVEASATLDLKQLCSGQKRCDSSEMNADLKVGRFIVPFGAFSAMVHPGTYRTVSNPLIFDMGRQVQRERYPAVLPLPFSDEGVNLNVGVPLPGDMRASLDTYAVNGLQGDIAMSFDDARAYFDNNREPAIGNRLTIGNQNVRAGGSLLFSNMQDDGDPTNSAELWGLDFTARRGDVLRLYAEYASRTSDTRFFRGDHHVRGGVLEAELRLLQKPRVGLLARYDTLNQQDFLAFPDSTIERFTWGFNINIYAGSMLILNHEVWDISDFEDKVHVVGLRWFASF